ncbi:MAG: Gfo/Idh/MocA family oxidoreductase [Clostridia bacterium]|nr:Gfo/Idh/MocA family oxidoreductase [Clostridia bacterium]
MSKTVVAVVGLGDRGIDMVDTALLMPDVTIKAVCDLRPERLERASGVIEKAGGRKAVLTKDYADILRDPDIEAVILSTSWNSHVPLAVEAMKNGKYAAFEVGAAPSVEYAWDLVRAYEETRVPAMMLCNCDYGDKELAVLRMIRSGVFGEVTHLSGGYHHERLHTADPEELTWSERSLQNLNRCGDLYPHHSLGPMMNELNINRGNRMLSLVSMASKNVGFTEHYRRKKTPEMPDLSFKMADVVSTLIRCANGETIALTHDLCTPRPYCRCHTVSGTKGMFQEEFDVICLPGENKEEKWEDFKPYLEKYRHPLWRDRERMREWHHNGMDFLVLRSFLLSVKNRAVPAIDPYDSATLLAIPSLTEQSIQKGSIPVAIPDFTGGRWMTPKKQFPNMFSLDEFHDELFTGDWTLETTF